MAANSTNGAPPSAEKEGGVAGDPRGAIRALGGTSQNDYKPEHKQGGRAEARRRKGRRPRWNTAGHHGTALTHASDTDEPMERKKAVAFYFNARSMRS